MPKVPIHKDFVHNVILARLLLLGAGDVDVTAEGVRFRLPGGYQALFTHRYEALDRVQMLKPDDRPHSMELDCKDAEHVASLMSTIDQSIRRAHRALPASFFVLADTVGREISSGYIYVQEAIADLQKGSLGGKFLAGLLDMSPGLQQAVDRLRSDTVLRVLPMDEEQSCLIHWYGWADRIERLRKSVEEKHEIDGFSWRKAWTSSGQFVLAQRKGGSKFVSLLGDHTIMTDVSNEAVDIYYLENASGALEMVANVDKDSGVTTIVGLDYWRQHAASFESVQVALNDWVAPLALKPFSFMPS